MNQLPTPLPAAVEPTEYRGLPAVPRKIAADLAPKIKALKETQPAGPCTISRALAPTADQRAWMIARREDLAEALEPGEREALRKRLHRFAFGFGQIRGQDVGAVAMMLEEWTDAVEDMPYDAVDRACKGWNKGAFDWVKTGMAPNADEIGRAVRETWMAMRCEDRDLRRLIEATPVDPERPLTDAERAGNLARMRRITAEIAKAALMLRARTPRERESAARAYLAQRRDRASPDTRHVPAVLERAA